MTETETAPIEVGKIATSDVYEHAEAIAPWCVRFTQLSSGGFRGRTDFVRTEGVMVYRERWNRRLTVAGASPPGFFMVGTTSNPSVQVHWSGRDVSESWLGCSRPAGEIEFSTSQRADHVVALVRADVLAGYLADAAAADVLFDRHLHCPPDLGRVLRDCLGSIVARHAGRPDLGNDPREAGVFESEVLGALGACAGWGPGPRDELPRRREAVRCAVAHAQSRVEPISVPELAAAAGVSQRTLEYAFREQLAITPLQFLRSCRLNGAHRELRSAAPEATTVTSVALRWGFSDLGRFASEHRRMFAALPSETLAETRPSGGPLL